MNEKPSIEHREENFTAPPPPSLQPSRIDRRGVLVLLVAIGAFLVLILAVVLIWRWRSASNAEEKTTPVVSVKVAKAEKDAIATQIVAVGTIWPREKSDVGVKISAQIKNMALLKNKLVRRGYRGT